jgi:integrase/recombinase XerD
MISTLIETYLIHLEAENRSAKTLIWHRSCLGKFAQWLETADHSPNPDEWSANTIRAYYVALKREKKPNGQPLAATSVSTYARSLRAFCNWLAEEDFAAANPMAKLQQPATPKLVKPVLSLTDCHAILKAAKTGRNGLRDTALILFMLDTGARASEVCGLTIGDVNWQQRLAKVYGKGAKERYVPFSAATLKAMQRYSIRDRDDSNQRMFQNEENKAQTPSGLLQLCYRIGERAGVELNPHKFRHTFAIQYLRSGASVFSLMKSLGHSSVEMSLRYSALMTEDLISDHSKHSPVAALLSKN